MVVILKSQSNFCLNACVRTYCGFVFFPMQMMALEKQYHDELKLELQGVKPSAISNVDKQLPDQQSEGREDSNLPDYQQIAEDTDNLSKVMMSRKKKSLYEAMQV